MFLKYNNVYFIYCLLYRYKKKDKHLFSHAMFIRKVRTISLKCKHFGGRDSNIYNVCIYILKLDMSAHKHV